MLGAEFVEAAVQRLLLPPVGEPLLKLARVRRSLQGGFVSGDRLVETTGPIVQVAEPACRWPVTGLRARAHSKRACATSFCPSMNAATPAPKHRLASRGCIADALVNASSASPKRCFSIAAVPVRARAIGSSSVRGPAAATEAASVSTAGAIRNRIGRVRRRCARRTPWNRPGSYWCSRPGSRSLCISGSTKVASTAAVGNVSSLARVE